MKLMLGGTDTEATVEVRRRAFRCAANIISKDLFDADDNSVDVFKAIFSGLTDVNRSVRLAAGYEASCPRKSFSFSDFRFIELR